MQKEKTKDCTQQERVLRQSTSEVDLSDCLGGNLSIGVLTNLRSFSNSHVIFTSQQFCRRKLEPGSLRSEPCSSSRVSFGN